MLLPRVVKRPRRSRRHVSPGHSPINRPFRGPGNGVNPTHHHHMCCGGSTNTSPPPPSLSYPRRASWSRDLGGNRPFNSVPHIVHVTQARMHEPAKALLAKMSQGCHRRWALPHRAGRAQDALPGHPRTGPQGAGTGTMDHTVEASAERVRRHLRRPDAGRGEPVGITCQKHRSSDTPSTEGWRLQVSLQPGCRRGCALVMPKARVTRRALTAFALVRARMPVGRGDSVESQDIPDRCLKTSRTSWVNAVVGVESPSGDHRRRRTTPCGLRGRRELRRRAVVGVRAASPVAGRG